MLILGFLQSPHLPGLLDVVGFLLEPQGVVNLSTVSYVCVGSCMRIEYTDASLHLYTKENFVTTTHTHIDKCIVIDMYIRIH